MGDPVVEFLLIWIFLCLGFRDAFRDNLLEALAVASVFAVYD
jgi:hypothetical protein